MLHREEDNSDHFYRSTIETLAASVSVSLSKSGGSCSRGPQNVAGGLVNCTSARLK